MRSRRTRSTCERGEDASAWARALAARALPESVKGSPADITAPRATRDKYLTTVTGSGVRQPAQPHEAVIRSALWSTSLPSRARERRSMCRIRVGAGGGFRSGTGLPAGAGYQSLVPLCGRRGNRTFTVLAEIGSHEKLNTAIAWCLNETLARVREERSLRAAGRRISHVLSGAGSAVEDTHHSPPLRKTQTRLKNRISVAAKRCALTHPNDRPEGLRRLLQAARCRARGYHNTYTSVAVARGSAPWKPMGSAFAST